jgi:thioredoxin 1
MARVRLTHRNFRDVIAAHEFVIVDFWASWCAPCLAFNPVFEDASARHPGVLFCSVETMQEPDLVDAHGIRAVPTLVLFRDGIEVDRVAAPGTAAKLDQLVERVGGLDMDEVRTAMLERQALP